MCVLVFGRSRSLAPKPAMHVTSHLRMADEFCSLQTSAVDARQLDALLKKRLVPDVWASVTSRAHELLADLQARPEMLAVLKAIGVSWALAMMLGLMAMCLGAARWYPPHKYLPWRHLNTQAENAYYVAACSELSENACAS